MLRTRAGDMEAFSSLVRRFQRPVAAIAYRYLGNEAEAEDLAQEAFLRVYRSRERYEPTAKFSTWLHRIVVNLCLNAIRARKARPAMSLNGMTTESGERRQVDLADPSAAAPHDSLERAELAERVRGAVDALPDNQRLALLMNKYQGLSYQEIADAMELSTMAVKSLLTRARVNVKRKLMPYLREGEQRWTHAS